MWRVVVWCSCVSILCVLLCSEKRLFCVAVVVLCVLCVVLCCVVLCCVVLCVVCVVCCRGVVPVYQFLEGINGGSRLLSFAPVLKLYAKIPPFEYESVLLPFIPIAADDSALQVAVCFITSVFVLSLTHAL